MLKRLEKKNEILAIGESVSCFVYSFGNTQAKYSVRKDPFRKKLISLVREMKRLGKKPDSPTRKEVDNRGGWQELSLDA